MIERYTHEELESVATAIVERLGGLEYVKRHDFPRVDGPSGAKWFVKVCPCCFTLVWASTSRCPEDSWEIGGSWIDGPFQMCGACDREIEFAPVVLQGHMARTALARVMLFMSDRGGSDGART